MSCTKLDNYSFQEFEISLLGRSVSHPARVKMVKKLLVEQQAFRNVDFVKYLGLNKSTVKKHIDILKEADLVNIIYAPHCYLISLNEKGEKFALGLFGKEVC